MSQTSADLPTKKLGELVTFVTISLMMPVLSKLDYCNSLLSGSPKHLLDKVQKFQNSAARLVFKALKHEHINPSFRNITGYQ